ncbi:hypothetical protein A6A19_00160 [Actinobacillus delphinicola]|uniref:Porin opacity type n=1 Tax=Actinobacillus delphinicola TaxID=51161 RepID=A0A448TVL5_9PAST|nr:opacity family porin [Actinobacillus delphinicola]MDG6896458.1 hypothetical protein [Actinobacillus delphinicola]VEJ09969.1 porin opacity type [Actinobacillus delphinicola]
MKKSLIATAILGLAMATGANADLTTTSAPDMSLDNQADTSVVPYAQIDLGMTRLMEPDDELESTKTGFSQRATIGLDFQGDRLGLDFTNFGRYKWNMTLDEGENLAQEEIKESIYGIGLSYTHVMMLDSVVHPYIGARIGYTHVKGEEDYHDGVADVGPDADAAKDSYSFNRFSYGAFGGVEFNITHNVTTGIGVEYDRLYRHYIKDFTGSAFLRVSF